MKLPAALQPLQARWAGLPERERMLVKVAAGLVLAAGLWQLLLAPAWQTLRQAESQARLLDAQLQHMQALQAQAQSLQSQPALGHEAALRALEQATQQVLGGSARLQVAGERASITLQGASPDALAQWLAQVRLNARAVPVETRLARAPGTGGATTWNGVIVMSLPAR
jgi:general secretion pathway protein M